MCNRTPALGIFSVENVELLMGCKCRFTFRGGCGLFSVVFLSGNEAKSLSSTPGKIDEMNEWWWEMGTGRIVPPMLNGFGVTRV